MFKMQEKTNKETKKLRICAVSDTHGEYYNIKRLIQQEGDILIFGGDFTYYGVDEDFNRFIQFLDALKGWKHKIVIAGNHQIVLDAYLDPKRRNAYYNQFPCKYSRQFIVQELKKRCIYLEHQYVQVEGLKIFGSPYTIYYCGSAFQIQPDKLKTYWNSIPQNLDILITHGPPFGIMDLTNKKLNAGCKNLLQKVKQVKPKVHLFGHIHQGRAKFGQCGYLKSFGTKFYNVAHKPLEIDFQ